MNPNVDELSNAPAERPAQVSTAVALIWVSLGLGVVNSVLDWRHLTSRSSMSYVLTVQLVTLAIFALLIYKTSCGRNWARLTFLILGVVGVPFFLYQLPAAFERAPISASVGVVQLLLQVGALYLVFSAPGRYWFRRRNMP